MASPSIADLPPDHAAPPALAVGGVQRQTPVIWAMLIALAISAIFVYLPWESMTAHGFPDRDNYLDAIDVLLRTGAELFDFSGSDLLALALNEYLWREVLLFVGHFSDDPSAGFTLVSLLAAAIVTFHVVRRAGVAYALPFLFAPLAVDLFLSQTRSALAFGIFLCALATRRSAWLRYVLFAVAFMIHSFAAVLVGIYAANSFLLSQARMSSRAKLLGALALGLAASIVWSFLANQIFSVIGDRRAEQEDILPASVPFAVWWMLITAMLVTFARLNVREGDRHYVMLAVTLQAMFVFTTVFGAGGLRFLSLSLPLVFIAISTIREPVLRSATVAGTITFNLFHTLLWVS
jgi:hypothetical protein